MSTFSITYNMTYADIAYVRQMEDYSSKLRKNSDSSVIEKYSSCLIQLLLRRLSSTKLVDKKCYSIEYICYNTPGFLKYSMHDILERLSKIACNMYTNEDIYAVFTDVNAFECINFAEDDTCRILTDFVWFYLEKTDSVKFGELKNLLSKFHKPQDIVTFIHTIVCPLN